MTRTAFSERQAVCLRLSFPSLYLAIVTILAVSAILNPDGAVSESAPWALTLPTGMLAALVSPPVIAILLAASLNAVILYFLAGILARNVGVGKAASVLFAGIAILGLVAWWLNDQDLRGRVRIVNNSFYGERIGAWMAIDDNGLHAWIAADDKELRALSHGNYGSDPARSRLLFIPNGTRGIGKRRAYLLKNGRLVDPYAATLGDMQRDGVVEVERIKINSGPRQGLEGWVPSIYLQRLLTITSL